MNVSKIPLAILAVFLLSGQAAFAQWATSGNSIYNTNSGNVGIGKTSPGLTLDVAGPIRSQSGTIDLRVQAGWAGAAALGTISNNPLLLISNATERMRINTNGKIGIGTTWPIGTLHVSSGAYHGGGANASADDLVIEHATHGGISILTPNSAIGQLVFGDTEIKMAGIVRYDHSDNSLFLGTNGADRLHINNIGNVGIGTASPVQLHHVHQTTGTSAGTSYSNSTTGATLTDGLYMGYDDQGYMWNYENTGLQFATNNTPRMTITADGNVGIGKPNPVGAMHVVGGIHHNFLIEATTGNPDVSLVENGNIRAQIMYHTGANGIAFYADDTRTGYPWMGGTGLLFISGTNTNVGIGTNFPSHKLTVNGYIRAEEVSVVPDVAPDFVFEDDYTLRTLEEVEQYIDEHGHLPEIPSAAEMKADGVGMSAMQMRLLLKIEELTLYLIEQNKVLADVQEENSLLKQRLIALETAGN